MKKASNEICAVHHCQVNAKGGGMMRDVKLVSYQFGFERAVSLEEARTLLVDCMQRVLRTFNEDEKVRPYLHNYPMDSNNLRLGIVFTDDLGRDHLTPNVCYCFLFERDGETYIHYSQALSHDCNGYESLADESLADAIAKVNAQKVRHGEL